MTLAIMTCLKMSSGGWLARLPWTEQSILVEFTSPSFLRATTRERTKLVIETILCGSSILFLSVLVDRFYYQFWTFPPLKFIYFNVLQSLSVFYGRNDWHYYLSQGFPLLLTTALPFAVVGIYQGFFSTNSTRPPLTKVILSQLATISCIVPAALSLISHKEVRFIYPLLPLLHILAAEPLTRFFAPSILHSVRSRRNNSHAMLRRTFLGLLILLNATISLYTTTIHNRGVLDVLTYLRHQHETSYLQHDKHSNHLSTTNLTVAFLMPCHSTPWRSHLIHPEIEAWALTCEPPLHLSPEAKETYLDEADVFYADPMLWLRQNMSRQPPPRTRSRGLISIPRGNNRLDPPGARSPKRERERGWEHGHGNSARKEHRPWPDYLVFFAQAEKTMDLALRGSGYAECWRGFNTRWHDDWRRAGDVVVWCLWPERRDTESKQSVGSRIGQTLQSVQDFAAWAARSGSETLLGHQKPMAGTVPATTSRDRGTSDNVLGGAKGPWGIGKTRRPRADTNAPARWWEPPWRTWTQWRESHKKMPTKKKRDVWS
jgi:GPI mannosyltransferase 3